MSLYAIGDIHGCIGSLDVLLDRLNPSADDHLVFVGDYVDRGPDSFAVIDRLLDLRDEVPCTFLRGNHEAFMLGFLDYGDAHSWRMNGGVSTIESYRQHGHDEIPDTHDTFLRDTELYYQTDDFFFVHAGLRPTRSIAENLEQHGEDVFLWERDHLEASTLPWEKPVVCGHTPQPEPINRDKLIAIDTGCVYHMHPNLGRLTAVRLPERHFLSIPYAG